MSTGCTRFKLIEKEKKKPEKRLKPLKNSKIHSRKSFSFFLDFHFFRSASQISPSRVDIFILFFFLFERARQDAGHDGVRFSIYAEFLL